MMINAAYTSYSDEELLTFLRNEDRSAFAEMYNRYHKPVYRYLLSLVKVPELAEDLVHEVFLKLWEIREKLEIRENFTGYLFRVCHNKAVDMTKKIAGERELRNHLLHHYSIFSTEEQRTLDELHRYDNLVEEALNALSPQRRRVYELCKKEGKSYQEIADELHISTNTVKEHMSKALAILRSFLENRGEFALASIMFCHF